MPNVKVIDTDTQVPNTDDVPSAPSTTSVDFGSLSTMEQLEMVHRQKAAVQKLSFDEALKDSIVAVSDVEIINKERKDTLIGVEFIITKVSVNQGNSGPFVSLTAVTRDDRTVVINDGSSGIASQMFELVSKYGVDKPIHVPGGLRKSVYYVDKDTLKVVGKEPQPNSFAAATYYLAI